MIDLNIDVVIRPMYMCVYKYKKAKMNTLSMIATCIIIYTYVYDCDDHFGKKGCRFYNSKHSKINNNNNNIIKKGEG